MATTTTIAFNGIDYPTKTSATSALREHVATIPLKTWLYPGDDDFEIILDALQHHWSWGARLDKIVKLRFERETGGGRACRVVLTSGVTDKVSWSRTFGAPPSGYGKVTQALRSEVRDQMQDFRDRIASGEAPAVCSLTKKPLLRDFEVDHYAPPFTDLASDWLDAQGGWERVAVHRVREGGYEITDDSLADDWWAYHRRHAKLRAVNAQPHKNRTRRQRKTVR